MFEIHWRRNFEWILHRMHHHLYGRSIPGWNATCRGTRFSTMEGCSSSCYKAFDVPRQHHWMDWRSVWKSGLRKWISKIHMYLYIYIMIYFFLYLSLNILPSISRHVTLKLWEDIKYLNTPKQPITSVELYGLETLPRSSPNKINGFPRRYLCSKGRYDLRY